MTVAGAGHTFDMRDPSTLFASLSLDAAGTKKDGVAFFAQAGKYEFFCAIPGHDAQGMHGTITVTGPTTTLTSALTAAGNPPTAAGLAEGTRTVSASRTASIVPGSGPTRSPSA